MIEGEVAAVGTGVPGRSWFDAYSLRAHWAPVLTMVAPCVFAAYSTFPEMVTFKGMAGGGLLVAALPPVLAQAVRDFGKRLEPELWASWGGKPSTRLLRHRDSTIPELTKRRYFSTLASAGIVRPTVEEEAADPSGIDRIYESAGDWLRRQTRDPRKAALVLSKNVAYGFARNLLGVRWIGVALTVSVGVTEAILAWRSLPADRAMFPALAAAAAVNLAAAVIWLLAVRPRWVRSAADAYALMLLECCEPEGPPRPMRQIGDVPATRTTRRKSSTPASNSPANANPESGA